MKRLIYLIIILSILSSGCNLSDNNDKSTPTTVIISQDTLPQQGPKQSYLLLTNNLKEAISIPQILINGHSTRELHNKEIVEERTSLLQKRIDAPAKSLNTTTIGSPGNRAIQNIVNYTVSDQEQFYVITKNIPYNDPYENISFTLRSKREDISGTDLDLYIWVDSNDDLSTIPANSIEYLADKFTNIYPDMARIYGEHWGEHQYTNIISPTRDDLHILLMDIAYDKNDNGDNGSIYGYFSDYDLLLKDENHLDTNSCLNVVLDSHVYFNRTLDLFGNTRNWSEDNRDTVDGISTLIHEYQHMINNYNKRIKLNIQRAPTPEEVFVDEMLAMAAEDLMAKKHLTFTISGSEYFSPPDGVRIPDFNTGWMNSSDFFWEESLSGSLQSYSNAYALGAYLIRNHENFISTYISSNKMGIDGIINAIDMVETDPIFDNYTRKDLLQNFGLAVLNSSKTTTSKPIVFNAKDFIDYNNYELANINLFSPLFYGQKTFKPYSLSTSNQLSSPNITNFKGESNIYIDLGLITNTDVIVIDFYKNNRNITYNIVY